ncbi:hypothetical protein, partial [Enterobacter intestinihominis]
FLSISPLNIFMILFGGLVFFFKINIFMLSILLCIMFILLRVLMGRLPRLPSFWGLSQWFNALAGVCFDMV